MRIVILSSYPIYPFRTELGLPDAPVSHPYPWVKNLALGLSKITGNDVHIMTMRRDVPADTTIKKDGISYHFLTPPPKAIHYCTLFQAAVWKVQKKLRQINPDIVHGQGTDRFSYFAVKSGFPNIITIHGVSQDFKKMQGSQYFRRDVAMTLWMERRCFKLAKNIIIISPFVRQLLQMFGSKAQCFEIENPVSEIFFHQREEISQHDLLFVGSITPRKRFIDLLKSLTLLPEKVGLRIVSFVTTPLSYQFEVDEYIKTHHLQDRVKFLGFRDEVGVAEEILRSKIVVLPSGAETAPMVIAEAMAIGRPVVATNVGGVPQMVDQGKTGFLISPGDVPELAKYIMQLLEDPSKCKSFGQTAQKTARERFFPEVVVQKTLKAYQTIVNGKQS